jgi:hypothetical protein
VALIRTDNGISVGIASRTRSVISSKSRIRFSKLPPYLSVRLLLIGLRNWWIRYPCAAWISICDASNASDFPDRDYFVTRIGSSRLSGSIIHSIYGQRSPRTSLSLRAQEAFRNLCSWLENLPRSLRIDSKHEAELDPRARSLHLLFNQVYILSIKKQTTANQLARDSHHPSNSTACLTHSSRSQPSAVVRVHTLRHLRPLRAAFMPVTHRQLDKRLIHDL